VSYTAVYSSFDGNVIRFLYPIASASVPSGTVYAWALTLVGGNSARFMPGSHLECQLAAFARQSGAQSIHLGQHRVWLKLHGDAVMDTVTVPGADAEGLEIGHSPEGFY